MYIMSLVRPLENIECLELCMHFVDRLFDRLQMTELKFSKNGPNRWTQNQTEHFLTLQKLLKQESLASKKDKLNPYRVFCP